MPLMSDEIFDDLDPDKNHFDINEFNFDEDSSQYISLNKFSNLFIDNQKNISLMTFNIRSFYCHVDEFLSVLESCNLMFDVIVLTETWLHQTTVQAVKLPGYKGYHCFRDKRQSGGVSIFVKSTLEVQALDINLSTDVIECI